MLNVTIIGGGEDKPKGGDERVLQHCMANVFTVSKMSNMTITRSLLQWCQVVNNHTM